MYIYKIIFPLILLIICHIVLAQDYQIYPKTNKDNISTFKITYKDTINLLLTKTKEKSDTISLVLTPFIGKSTGEEINVTFKIAHDSAHYRLRQLSGDSTKRLSSQQVTQLSNVIIDKASLPIQLIIPDLPSYQSYEGSLVISRAQAAIKAFQLQLEVDSLHQAKVMVDLKAPVIKYTKPLFTSNNPPEFIWHIYEKSRNKQLKGVYAELKEYSSTNENFLPKSDLSFKFNGKDIDDFWGLTPDSISKRTVQIGGQAKIAAQVNTLTAGEYKIKIKFLSRNAKTSDEDLTSTMTLKVKDHWFWAAFWLTLAIIFSFFTNKWINTRRQKLQLRKRISDLNPAWLRTEPPSLGVIKAKSALKLLEDLTNKLYISNSNLIEEKLDEVQVLIKHLYRCRNLRKKIEHSGLSDMKYRRALKNYRRISNKIGTDAIDTTISAEIKSELDSLELWFQPDQFDKYYFEDLMQDVNQLLSNIGNAHDFPDEHKEAFGKILDKLKTKVAHPDDETEDLYAVVKVLWERRLFPDIVGNLLDYYNKKGSVELLFLEVDRLEWKNLKEKHLKFISPKITSLRYTEAYQPIWFKVMPDDPADANNYLFKHGLCYEWEITIVPYKSAFKKWWGNLWNKTTNVYPKLTPVTNEPKVIQFIPKESTIQYKVTVRYYDPHKVSDEFNIAQDGEGLTIIPSSIFNLNKAFQNIELFALIASWLVAGISGLLTFYFKNDTFGQMSDYLTLFLWGAGVDQAKNFIQNYQAYSKKSEPTPG